MSFVDGAQSLAPAEGNLVDHHAASANDALPAGPSRMSTMIQMQPMKRSEMQPSHAHWQEREVQVTHGICGYVIQGLGIIEGLLGSVCRYCCCCQCGCRYPLHNVDEGSVGLVSRFGQFYKTVGPGLVQVNACTESLKTVDIRLQIVPIGKQTVITRDNVKIEIDSDIYLQICDPYLATFGITDWRGVLIERAQIILRHVVGAREVQSVLTEHEAIASEIAEIVGVIANKCGVAIEYILIKSIDSQR